MRTKQSSKSHRPRIYIKRIQSNYDLDFDGRQHVTVLNKQNGYNQDTEPKAECSVFSVTLKTEGEQYGFSLQEQIRTREGLQVNCHALYIHVFHTELVVEIL